MFDIAPTEFLLVVVVALVVIGPKDLPKAMRFVGKWMGKARAMARHFRAGMDTMMREAELEELEKQWKAQNEEIMRQFPSATDVGTDTSASKPSAQGGSGAVDDGDPMANGTSVQSDFDAASQSPNPMESSGNAGPHPDAETHIVPPRSSELP
ncbi:Sec-independent protein translocase protein TatB [Sphingopyxis yananensis]|uniref:Sec-independent protein translocase protein TatB n=1 Tax=Sphingopyxis yananensis TaxID=2886687 RepID=UPI001D0FC1A8|nr:Sec-independent protein translocase protein TatB [Sphingopyxis yananensis]MCC2603529.1 Sec-independent protein translocase protein TatB [Sphingopyxis yananensis]